MSPKDWVDHEIKEIPPDMKTCEKTRKKLPLGGHKDVVKFITRDGIKNKLQRLEKSQR